MKNVAVLCEYDPFHSGHAYQLSAIRSAGADNILCVMSGQFVQSALPAFCDKAIRAQTAVENGADAVIELPVIYSTAGAQYFAEGYIKLVSGIKNLSHIAMGATSDEEIILRLAELKRSNEFTSALKNRLADGMSYNAATARSLCELYAAKYTEQDVSDVVSEPNNILCIEYICALNKLAPQITPLIIMRKGAHHTDITENAEHISATAIRNAFCRGEEASVKRYIRSYSAVKKWRKNHAPDIELYKSITVFAIKCADTQTISKLRDCSEGLEYLIKRLPSMWSYDKYMDEISGKRYGKKRIARLFLDAVLDITRDLLELPFCTRLLACKKTFDFSILPDLVKTDNASIKAAAKADCGIARVLKADEAASALYSSLCRTDGDYYNYSLIKV